MSASPSDVEYVPPPQPSLLDLSATVAQQEQQEQDQQEEQQDAFEGPEKKLEMEFAVPEHDPLGMRAISQAQWQTVLNAACCTILSRMSNDHCDSFVLSESSLFVFRHKIMLKTCGTTTLLHCVPLVLEHAARLHLDIKYCLFSRKSLNFPMAQKHPHQCHTDETAFLDKFFDGNAYILGPLKGDYWFVYQYDAFPEVPAAVPEVNLEIMMHDLSPAKMSQFFKKAGLDAKTVSQQSGIVDLLPGSMVDEFLFDPCGYSMNGLIDEAFWTIHITPEDHCSYVSFETNVQLPKYVDLINRVFHVFEPGRCTVTLFVDEGAIPSASVPAHSFAPKSFPGYSMSHRTYHEFDGTYDVTMTNLVRVDPFSEVPDRIDSPNSRGD